MAELISFLALVISGIAVYISWRSMKSSEKSSAIARRSLERTAQGELHTRLNSIQIEHGALQRTLRMCRSACKDLFINAGGLGGSRQRLLDDQFDQWEAESHEVMLKVNEISRHLENATSGIQQIPEHDATRISAQLLSLASKLTVIRENAATKLAELTRKK